MTCPKCMTVDVEIIDTRVIGKDTYESHIKFENTYQCMECGYIWTEREYGTSTGNTDEILF